MSESINPNVSMTETQSTPGGKIELNSSSGPVSFDELEQIERESKKAKSAAKKAEKESGDKSESKDKKSVDLTSDTDKGGKADKKDAPKDTKESKTSENQQQENKENLEKARKLIKAKFQDKELDLDEEAVVPVKINGKEELVQIKDLLGNYSGKVAWDKKFTEISKKEKDVKTLELRGKQAVESLKSVMEEKDPTIRMFRMAQMAGIDPVTYRQNFLADNINLLEKWYAMSDDERKADQLAYEAQYHKHRADTLESSTKEQQAQRELNQRIEQLRVSHQIPEELYLEAMDQVQQAVQQGSIDKSHLQPEKIIEIIKKDQLWNAVELAVQAIDLPWNDQERGQRMFKLVEDAHNLGFKPEEMAEMVSEIWGDKKAQKKVAQIKQEREEFLSGKKDVQQVAKKSEGPTFFDEMF